MSNNSKRMRSDDARRRRSETPSPDFDIGLELQKRFDTRRAFRQSVWSCRPRALIWTGRQVVNPFGGMQMADKVIDRSGRSHQMGTIDFRLGRVFVTDGTSRCPYRSDRPSTEECRLDDRDVDGQASDFEDWFRESAEIKR
jgi:hypothetical protein